MSTTDASTFLIVHHPADSVHAEWIQGVLQSRGEQVVSRALESDGVPGPALLGAIAGRGRVLVLLSPDCAGVRQDLRAALSRAGVDVLLVRVRGPESARDDGEVVELGGLVGSRRRRALLAGLELGRAGAEPAAEMPGAEPAERATGSRTERDRPAPSPSGGRARPGARRGGGEEEVQLGASAPAAARPGDEFTARFIAYAASEAAAVEELLRRLSPRSETHLGVKRCRWKRDTRVTVSLSGKHLLIDDPRQEFVWTGEHQLIDFDVTVDPGANSESTILKFDVAIDGIVVAKLRVDLALGGSGSGGERAVARGAPARTAFASYSSQDRDRVLDRVAAVSISAGLDVFLDCLSLHPGEEWKPTLHREILERDQFLLFWSSHASESEWVAWEMREALARKPPDCIQVHPLEPVDRAPPPPELQHLHFGDPYVLARSDSRGESPPS